MHHSWVLFLFLFSCVAFAQDSSMEQVGLRLAKEPVPECQIGKEGSLAGGAVTILPGDTICLKTQIKGDSVVPVAVTSTADPEDTLIVSLWQEPGTDDMYLTLRNPLGSFLKYKAYMLRPNEQQREYTSSCLVLSRRLGIEQWPHLVSEITLSDFKAVPESKSVTCE
ncbi:MAG: hypothetical protein EON58_06165 [Alphaproteobacteria bacterium]|nr:MAG: hypothetical protein EON58_06165 [Alphaproteobacteria bacterium]